MTLRKTLILKETIEADESGLPCDPITRVVAMAVVKNPFAGSHGEDLSALFEAGRVMGERLMAEAVGHLTRPAIGYGKAALVGADGAMEHGAAMIHPQLGKPMRAAVGGGKSLIPANAKIGAVGATIDIPLGHKDDPWEFDHIDTISVMVGDAPRPDEILLCMAIADGPRAHPRVGKGPNAT